MRLLVMIWTQGYIYRHLDLNNLEECLNTTHDKRYRFIVTDRVFSIDREFSLLANMAKVANKYDALLFLDESHATGFIEKMAEESG